MLLIALQSTCKDSNTALALKTHKTKYCNYLSIYYLCFVECHIQIQLHLDSANTDIIQDLHTLWFPPAFLVFKTLRRFPVFPSKPQSFIFLFLPADLLLPWLLDLSFSSTLYVSLTMLSSPGNTVSHDLVFAQIFLILDPVLSSSLSSDFTVVGHFIFLYTLTLQSDS